MRLLRWTTHALRSLSDRGIERSDAERAIEEPMWVVPDPPGREIRMRRYFDSSLQREMLLRVVVEETASEVIVITLYKTSQLRRYLREQ